MTPEQAKQLSRSARQLAEADTWLRASLHAQPEDRQRAAEEYLVAYKAHQALLAELGS